MDFSAGFMLLPIVVPVVVGAIALVALWRIMKAQEEIARHLAAIERKMGGSA